MLAWFFYRTSVRQDTSHDPALTIRMERVSAFGLILFALTANFAAFDLLMSLDPHWFSTIFGVYFFAVSVVVFYAVMPKTLVALQSRGVLDGAGLEVELCVATKAIRPATKDWRWPETLFRQHLPMLVDKGHLAAEVLDAFVAAWEERSRDPSAVFFSSPVLEVIGRRPGE